MFENPDALYHVVSRVQGGDPYIDHAGRDRWDDTAAVCIALWRRSKGEYWYVKEVADPRVQWLVKKSGSLRKNNRNDKV